MNLRVDLILPSEQRNPSLFTPAFVVKVIAFSIPVLIGASLAFVAVHVWNKAAAVDKLERQWLEAEPKQEMAIRIASELNVNRRLKEELDGWRRSQIVWHTQLAALPRLVPPAVQLIELNTDQVLMALEKDKAMARSFTMQIRGRSVGKGSDIAVDELEQNLRTFSVFATQMESVEVAAFSADTSKNASPDDRLFEIRCRYKPRAF